MNEAGATVKEMGEMLRAVEEAADAANLMALEMVLGRFESESFRDGRGVADEQVARAVDHAERATAGMARFMRSAGLV